MDKAVKGFTLIELVVVITILGILAAFAFPRFAALETEARTATVEGLGGSLRSAASLAHSLSLATGNTVSVTMEGNTINLVNEYPDAETIDDSLVDFTGFSFTVANGNVATFSKTGASGTCEVTYTEAAANSAPAIADDTSGC